MNTKQQVISGIIGGIVGSLITALVVSSGTAQREKFGDIEVSSLRIVDAAGKSYVLLGMDEDGGNIAVNDEDGKTRIILSTDTGAGWKDENIRVRIVGDDLRSSVSVQGGSGDNFRETAEASLGIRTDIDLEGEKVVRKQRAYAYAYSPNRGTAELSSDEHGGTVRVDGKNSKGNTNGVWLGINQAQSGGVVEVYGLGDNKSVARLGIIEDGGLVSVYNKDGDLSSILSTDDGGGGSVYAYGKDGQSRAVLHIGEYGGEFHAVDKDGRSVVSLVISEHGGTVQVRSKGEKAKGKLCVDEYGGRVSVSGNGKGQAGMGINEYGNGAVSTWDKNGYRQ